MNSCSLIRLGGCLALLAGSAAIAAGPALANPSALTPKPPTTAVADPVSADPAGASRGTMIMVHGGGWAGHSQAGRDLLSKRPGELLLARGWRVVSIDHHEGAPGLQDILNVAGAELARNNDGPLCIYGESSGAHFALIAASRLRSIDCVIGLGTPTDLPLYQAEGSASADFRIRLVVGQINRFFGLTTTDTAAWDPVTLAPSIRADVLLINEGDDTLVPAIHMARFQAARPTTQTVQLPPGSPAEPSTHFVHGTISETGRAQYAGAIGSFADRAVAAWQAERSATRTGCAQVTRPITQTGLPGLQSALRCLARNDAVSLSASPGSWQRTSVKIRGEVSAARIWSNLRATKSGRQALVAVAKRHTNVSVRAGDQTRVILRVTR